VADVGGVTQPSTGRTSSAGTDLTYRPRPHSWSSTYDTDARHSPSGQRTQASCMAGTQRPSWRTSTGRGSSKRRVRGSVTPATVGRSTADTGGPTLTGVTSINRLAAVQTAAYWLCPSDPLRDLVRALYGDEDPAVVRARSLLAVLGEPPPIPVRAPNASRRA
jgi:hypothetical protein